MRAETALACAKPWVMIDHALEVDHGTRAVSVKNITGSDFYLIGHFPDYSVYPGMLLLEGLMQTAEFIRLQRKRRQVWTERELRSRFLYPVVPGDRVKYILQCTKEDDGLICFDGEGWVNEIKVIDAVLIFGKEGDPDSGGAIC